MIVQISKKMQNHSNYLRHGKYTVGKISVRHVTNFVSKYICNGATKMKFSPDINNDPLKPHVEKIKP